MIVGTSGPNPAVGAGIALARTVGALRGTLYRSRTLNNIAFGTYNKRIQHPVGKYDWLSHDGEVLRKYAQDKRCTFVFTVKGFEDMFTLLRRVNRKDWASKVPADLPLLLMAGTEDPVGNYGKGVEWVQSALQTAGASSELLLYPKMRHEIFNETDNDKVYEDLSLWLEKHL